jgi:DNA invertase Pin-like site-specific DNA recombinase
MKVALYTRVSKADGSQDVERQIKDLKEFARLQNWQIVCDIKEAISGAKTTRSGTQKLINLARANQIQKVLIHEISRLGRNVCDVYNTVEELAKNKVSVYDFNQRQETLDLHFQKTTFACLILPLLAGMAEEWTKQHVFRIKSGLNNAKQKGIKLGRPKATKLKKENEIIKIITQGYFNDEFEKKQKASYAKIAKHLGVSIALVSRVVYKHKGHL